MLKYFVALLLIFSALAEASETSSSKEKKSTAVGDKKNWSIETKYDVSTDYNKPNDNRTTKHRLEPNFGYELNEKWLISTGTAIKWYANGNNINNEQDNPNWEDYNLGIAYNTKIFTDSSMIIMIQNEFPTGNESRQEGIRSALSPAVTMIHPFFDKKMNISYTLLATYYVHTYDISPISKESNADWVTTAIGKLGISPIKNLSLNVRYMLVSAHLINGENQLARNSTEFGIGYKFGKFGTSLSYLFGNYEENDGYRALYFDDTKRIFKLGVGFEI